MNGKRAIGQARSRAFALRARRDPPERRFRRRVRARPRPRRYAAPRRAPQPTAWTPISVDPQRLWTGTCHASAIAWRSSSRSGSELVLTRTGRQSSSPASAARASRPMTDGYPTRCVGRAAATAAQHLVERCPRRDDDGLHARCGRHIEQRRAGVRWGARLQHRQTRRDPAVARAAPLVPASAMPGMRRTRRTANPRRKRPEPRWSRPN